MPMRQNASKMVSNNVQNLHRHPKLSKKYSTSRNYEIQGENFGGNFSKKKSNFGDQESINVDKFGRKYPDQDGSRQKNQVFRNSYGDVFENFDQEINNFSKKYDEISTKKPKYSIGVVIKRSKQSEGYKLDPNPNYMLPKKFMPVEEKSQNLSEILEGKNSPKKQKFGQFLNKNYDLDIKNQSHAPHNQIEQIKNSVLDSPGKKSVSFRSSLILPQNDQIGSVKLNKSKFLAESILGSPKTPLKSVLKSPDRNHFDFRPNSSKKNLSKYSSRKSKKSSRRTSKAHSSRISSNGEEEYSSYGSEEEDDGSEIDEIEEKIETKKSVKKSRIVDDDVAFDDIYKKMSKNRTKDFSY